MAQSPWQSAAVSELMTNPKVAARSVLLFAQKIPTRHLPLFTFAKNVEPPIKGVSAIVIQGIVHRTKRNLCLSAAWKVNIVTLSQKS
jgi:hypothetical protein